MNTKASEIFRNLDAGIMILVKAADLYTLQLLARRRNEQVSQDLIDIILRENRISGFTIDSNVYLPEEIAMLERTGLFRQVGEQIVLATYTAVEIYLIEKFKEYFSHRLRNASPELVQRTLNRFTFRSLQEISGHYFDILGIHLPSFDFQFFTDAKARFVPHDSWAALNLLSTARNEIAHKGSSSSYKIAIPVDSWYPFEFVRGWVSHFDANFDIFVYEEQEPSLIKDYKQRLQQLTGK
jgi:hypothetical protein